MANNLNFKELSHERTGDNSVSTIYKTGNTFITVKSDFIGGAALEDLLFEAIKRTYDNRNIS